jgi:hypothetical protein
MFSLCFLAALLFAEDQPKPLPELKSFLAEVRKNMHTDGHLLGQYTYTEKRTLSELDSKKNPKTSEVNVFQVFPGSPERVGYRRQIVKDGVPLSSEELKKEDQKVQKRIEAAERRRNRVTPAERERNRAEELRREDAIVGDAFGVYEVVMAGRENIEGRPAILLTFHPRLSYRPKTFEGKTMQHFSGKAWFDEEDHQMARVELEAIDTISVGLGVLARLQKGASIVAERRKFNDEIWLPVKSEVTLNARVMMLKGFNIRLVLEYSEHKKYTVDTILKFPE